MKSSTIAKFKIIINREAQSHQWSWNMKPSTSKKLHQNQSVPFQYL
jgi:hypothetical protein